MNIPKRCLAFAFLAAVPAIGVTQPAGLFSVGELLDVCSSSAPQDRATCDGLFAGMLMGFSEAHGRGAASALHHLESGRKPVPSPETAQEAVKRTLHEMQAKGRLAASCVPEEAGFHDVTETILTRLDELDEDQPAAATVFLVMREQWGYPCKVAEPAAPGGTPKP